MSAATTTPHTPWPTVKLGDVCELKNGYTPKAEELSEQGVIPYFRISAMNFEGNEKRMIKPTAWLVSKKRCFNAGSIVFPKNGGAVYTRKVRVLEHDSVVDLNTGVCTPDKKTIECEYLYHWFSNLNITDVVVEGTIPFVDFGMLREVSIPLPPLDVQREIVAKVEAGLKEADALAAHFKRLAALADDTFKAELESAIQGKLVEQRLEEGSADTLYAQIEAEKQALIKVGKLKKGMLLSKISIEEIPFDIPTTWKWVRWGDVSHTIQYGYNTSAQSSGRIRIVRITDIQDGKINWNTVPYCNIEEDEINGYLLQKNDILFARTGGTVGKSHLIEETPNEAIFAGYLIRTRYGRFLQPKYLRYFMDSNLYWEQLKAGSISTAQPNCNGKTLAKMILPLPPLEEQQRIVEKLEAVKARCEQLKAEAERGLKAAEALRKAVLAEAFEQ